MKRVIQIMAESDVEFKDCIISENEWKVLEVICEYLKPFYEITKDLSTQKNSSICIVLPVFNALTQYMLSAKNSDNQNFEDCVQKMYLKIDKYGLRLKDNISYFAVILDPRLNIKFLKEFLKDKELENIRNIFFIEFKDNYSKSKTAEINEEQDSGSSLWRKVYKKRKINESEEINEYFNLAQEPESTQLIDWWKTHESIFPCLSNFAFDILCIPATSVPSEQIFSKAGDLIRKKRNKLSENSIRSLMCLNSFNAYFDSEKF
jgi:hypothetical protein